MERASWWVDEVVIFDTQRVTERQMWCKKVGRKKETGRRLYARAVSLLEDIQPISSGIWNDHTPLQRSLLTIFAWRSQYASKDFLRDCRVQ